MTSFIKYFLFLILPFCCLSFNPSSNYQLIVFEGSDWCAKCKRFEKNILSDSSFTQFLEANSITIEKIDFPQRKKLSKEVIEYNSTIADKYNFDGNYPTILLTKLSNSKYLKVNYINQSPSELSQQIQVSLEQLK